MEDEESCDCCSYICDCKPYSKLGGKKICIFPVTVIESKIDCTDCTNTL